MAWVVVPCLEELREQLNAIAPGRDKTSDGGIGDTSHSASRSSHNPDRTGNPEYKDGDAADEVRARDFDVDLNTPGLTMLAVVRHLVEGARQGRFWWLRYVIFQGVIYSRNTAVPWQARTYTGANSHHHHAHVNSDFTQAADTVRGVDYRLEDLVALSNDDKQWLLANLGPKAQWTTDGIIAAPGNPKPGKNADGSDINTHWAPQTYLQNTYDAAASARTSSAGIAASLKALPGAVRAELEAELNEVGGTIDGARIQAAVEKALGRLQLTVKPEA